MTRSSVLRIYGGGGGGGGRHRHAKGNPWSFNIEIRYANLCSEHTLDASYLSDADVSDWLETAKRRRSWSVSNMVSNFLMILNRIRRRLHPDFLERCHI